MHLIINFFPFSLAVGSEKQRRNRHRQQEIVPSDLVNVVSCGTREDRHVVLFLQIPLFLVALITVFQLDRLEDLFPMATGL